MSATSKRTADKGTPHAEKADGAKRTRAKGTPDSPPRIFLKRGPDGEWRRQWVGRYTVDGKRKDATLCRWEGTPPTTPTGVGDAAFERSRERAFQMLADAMRSGEVAGQEALMVQRVHQLRYGGKVERARIADLAARWDALPHKADLTEARRDRVHSVLKRFRDFMRDRFPNVTEVGALTAEHFRDFLADVDASGVSARSWNDYLSILRGVLAKVDGNSKGFREYLANLPKKQEHPIHRRPFTGAELDAIFAAALEIDPDLYPAIVTAACTAMRRGDSCCLQWRDIDLEEGFATVKTAKTGETVTIPIFPAFRRVLVDAAAKRKKGVPYVWPRIALAYTRNADGLNDRLNRVLARAGFAVPKRQAKAKGKGAAKRYDNGGKFEAPEDAEAAAIMLEAGMKQAGWTAKRKDKARRILELHFAGKQGKEIAEAVGASAGTVSDYLHSMEEVARIALVSAPKIDESARATLAEIEDGEQRKQRGSLCGWHSFRTTFCTLALENNVPMEILQKITGHKTGEIVLKHYDRRGREAMRKVIGDAMPQAIAGAAPAATLPPAGEVLEGEAVEIADAPAAGATRAQRIADALADVDAATLAKIEGLLQRAGRSLREVSR